MYEHIVQNPEIVLKDLFAFCDEPWDPSVLSFYKEKRNLGEESSAEQVQQGIYTSSVGRWKNDLTLEQKQIIKDCAGQLLIDLGYANDFSW
jgi:hypothetical protein